MAQNLIGKLRNGFYKTLATASLLGSLNCPMPIEPIQRLSQITQLQNYIDISYRANLENVSQATRKTMYNGNLVETKMISVPSYPETLTNKPKGDYCFILEAPGVTPDTSCVVVPNYQSETPDLNQLNLNLNERDSLVVNLKRPTDKNLEDNPVRYLSATSSDGKTTPSIGNFPNDSVLKIKAVGTPGSYQVELSREGSLEKILLQGQIMQLPSEQIAFRMRINGNDDIYVGDLINGNSLANIRRLTTDPAQDLHPSWSPDGEYLAWTTNRDGLNSIYIMKKDGTNTRKLTPTINTSFLHPSWSPDGTQISFVFIDRNLLTNGIAKINVNGTDLVKLIENPGIGTAPEGTEWSHIGRIFYNDIIENNSEIFSIRPDGTDRRRLTNTNYNEALPDVSPLGDRVAFVSSQFGGEFSGFEVMSMAIDGTDVRRITNTNAMEADPKYSNDGKLLIYSRYNSVSEIFQFHLANPDGSGEILLPTTGSVRYPAWRPKQP